MHSAVLDLQLFSGLTAQDVAFGCPLADLLKE